LIGQEALALEATPRREAIDAIHRGTAIYTAVPEIEALLDRLGWPDRGRALLDPGCGNGGFLVSALGRLDLAVDDVAEATRRVHGYEFHEGAATAARNAVAAHLVGRGWSPGEATRAACGIVEVRDFLLSPVPVGRWDVIAANPPYWRYANLPPEYRFDYEAAVPAHAKADLLYAYLQKSADIVAEGGRIGLVTADRWLLNSGSAKLRARIGSRYSVEDVRRLESASAFYRPKSRSKGTPARVHPVSMVLTPGDGGRALDERPFMIEEMPRIDGVPLSSIATIRLAPWLGPDGIFMVQDKGAIPDADLVPCYEPEDIDAESGSLSEPRRWAIATGRTEPGPEILAHLDATLHAMPKRGRQRLRWLPPEPFEGKLPLRVDSILVPRISRTLRPVLLPAGTMPVNHNLVVVSGGDPADLIAMLRDPRVTAQADAMALRLESGYRSYTATLLRNLVIPHDMAPEA
jgi:hypothetical protein